MEKSLQKLLRGHAAFQHKYQTHDKDLMEILAIEGQKPEIMVVACCDSRVDPAILLQCKPGDLFVVRNVANIIPPFHKDGKGHSTSAALEFAVCYLNIKHLIILGHSQCGGIAACLKPDDLWQNDFITDWVSLTKLHAEGHEDPDACSKRSLNYSYQNCLTYPWLKEKLDEQLLTIHRWFFNINNAEIYAFSQEDNKYQKLDANRI